MPAGSGASVMVTRDAPGGIGIAAGVPVGEDDAAGGVDLEHLADGFDAIGMADVDAAAGTRVDGGAGAPPAREAVAVLEKPKDGFGVGLNGDGAVETVREVHVCFLFRGFDGRGPRRD